MWGGDIKGSSEPKAMKVEDKWPERKPKTEKLEEKRPEKETKAEVERTRPAKCRWEKEFKQGSTEKIEAIKLPETKGKELEKRKFISNQGREITYDEAVDETKGLVSGLIDSAAADRKIEVSKEVKAGIVKDIDKSMKQQQAHSDQQNISDHGIRHIKGNVERADAILKDKGPETRLAAVIANVYHDAGYMDDSIHKQHGTDKPHDALSAESFRKNQLELYEKVPFIKEKMPSILKAMEYHNRELNKDGRISGLDKAGKVTDINEDEIVAAVMISDKLAIGEREKLNEVYTNGSIAGKLYEFYLAKDAARELPIEEQRKMVVSMKDAFNASVRKSHEEISFRGEGGLSKKQEKIFDEYILNGKAIEDLEQTDIDRVFDQAKYFASLNAVDTSELPGIEKTAGGKERVVAYINTLDEKSAEAAMNGLTDRQLVKFFEDLGLKEKEQKNNHITDRILPDLKEKGEYLVRGRNIKVKLRDIPLKRGDERIVRRRALMNVHKRYEKKELRDLRKRGAT